MHTGGLITDTSDSAVAARTPTGRWVIIGLLFFAILVNYIDRGNLSIVAVPVMREFGVSASRMGTLLSAFFWTYALLQVPAGYLVDRFGLKWTYAGAFLLWSLASAAVGVAGTFAQILFLRLLLGVGEAAAQPASLAFIRRNFPADQQGLPTAIYLSGMSFGPALGAIVGASLLSAVGWRPLFIITGLGACIWIFPWLVLVPRDATPRPTPAVRRSRVAWRVLLQRPTLWGITCGAFFYSYFWYYCLTWLPSYLVMARGFSFLKMGAFTAAPFLGTALISMLSGRVADRLIARFGQPILVRKIFVVSGFLLGSSILLLLALKSAPAVLAVLMLSLMGIGIASANYWALTQAASPVSMIGRVIGCQNTVANLAGICAPILTGFLVDRTKSFDISIAFAGVSLLVAAAAFLFLVRQRDVDELNALYHTFTQ
jgi:ACS family D-galactonate transporter-like MFS transporter